VIELLIIIAAQVTSSPPAAPQEEIIVTARRLKEWRGKVSGQANGSRCKTKGQRVIEISTGSPATVCATA
jgi:hypothetical protein